MPEETGRLTNDEFAKISQWIEQVSKTKSFECQFCGNLRGWSIEDYLVSVPTAEPMFSGASSFDEKAYPFVLLLCKECGQTVFLNAITIGIVEEGYGDG